MRSGKCLARQGEKWNKIEWRRALSPAGFYTQALSRPDHGYGRLEVGDQLREAPAVT